MRFRMPWIEPILGDKHAPGQVILWRRWLWVMLGYDPLGSTILSDDDDQKAMRICDRL